MHMMNKNQDINYKVGTVSLWIIGEIRDHPIFPTDFKIL